MSPEVGSGVDRAIIFGGSGFIGTHLAKALTSAGKQVVVADIEDPRQLPRGAQFVHCDVRERLSLDAPESFTDVYLLAAVHRTPGHQPHEYYMTNVGGTQNVIDWVESVAHRVRRVLFTSSISVYGPVEESTDESRELNPNSDYGRSKLISEWMLRSWVSRSPNSKLAVVRPAVVFGPGEGGNFTRLAKALRRRTFAYPGTDSVIKGCGYVDDLVRAIQFLMDREEKSLTANYCYPREYTTKDICEAFNATAGYALPPMIPAQMVGAVKGVMHTLNPADRGSFSAARVTKLTASTNVVPAELLRLGFVWDTDLESALSRWQTATPEHPFT